MRRLIFIFCLLLVFAGFAQNATLFEQGKEMYKAEKYQQALEQWNKILDNGEHSAALYYNLGNAHYKLNNIGESIYYYEKALQLSPSDNDIKNNLAFAQNATVDDIEPLPETIFSKWYGSLSGILTYNGWALLSIFFSVGFVILFLVYYISITEVRKRFFFTSSIVFLGLLMTSLTMAFMVFDQAINDHPAIIFSEKTEVRSEPNLGSQVSFSLHEGTKVQIIARDSDWVRIEIADGKDGWIPNSELKEL
jgi:tetratricopeptide (TPR) repeat protein